VDLARRHFLRGRTSSVPAPLRPPWVADEAAFTSACTRCGDCLSACPTGVLSAGPGNFPIVDFNRAHCTFCGDCSRACAPHAIASDISQTPWDLSIRISSACLAEQDVVCRTCGEICEVAAIRFAPRLGGVSLPSIDHERCTGCGECLAPCPTQAIAIEHRHTPNPQEIAA